MTEQLGFESDFGKRGTVDLTSGHARDVEQQLKQVQVSAESATIRIYRVTIYSGCRKMIARVERVETMFRCATRWPARLQGEKAC
jgi:hypothetical protein